MANVIFVSNRLPVTVQKDNNTIEFNKSIGGLATGLKGYHEGEDSLWFGYPGLPNESLEPDDKTHITNTLQDEYKCVPVYLGSEDFKGYYEGFSNKTLWPLFHYFSEKTEHDKETWDAYKRVNQTFFDALKDHIDEDSIIWVHDYQLMLLPKLIRDAFPEVKIGFFLHIPFPSYEIFRLLIWQKEIISGLLGSDLIGFHTYDYVRHFLSSVRRVFGVSHKFYKLAYEDREIQVDAFPMGIDYDFFASSKVTLPDIKERVILSVDRLDYTKGIIERLNAFRTFLRHYPEHHKNVKMHLIVAPSRDTLDTYETLKEQIEVLVSEINGEFGSFSWMPIWFLYQKFDQEELIGYYKTSDVMLVSPIRDGMNLIAKEYLAARTDGLGVLIISETAGAASELSEAIIVNPNDDVMIADSINEALLLSNKEKKARHTIMQKRLKRYDVTFWAETFIERLKSIEHTQPLIVKEAKNLNNNKTVENYKKASKRLFILDYDGTLSPIRSLPHQAKPKKALKNLLTTLSEQNNTDVVVISGRDKDTLESWLGNLPIALASDHGVWIKRKNKTWSNTLPNDQHWLESVSNIIQKFSDEMPGSFIEEKTHSIAFHYRNSEPDMVSVKLPELKEALRSIIGRQPIEMQDGRRVLEIKDQRMNKGQAALSFSSEDAYDFIFIAGDDTTDEDMFKTHPNHYTVKIGYGETNAKYRLKDPDALHDLLQTFIKATK